MKESFGFIERADVVKEIFFHFSEAKTKEELRLGDDVEFTIQTRNVSNDLYVQTSFFYDSECQWRLLIVEKWYCVTRIKYHFMLHDMLLLFRVKK